MSVFEKARGVSSVLSSDSSWLLSLGKISNSKPLIAASEAS